VFKDQLDSQVLKVFLVLLELWDPLEILVLQAEQALLDQQALQAFKAQLVFKDPSD
jgi:hypothetical protein